MPVIKKYITHTVLLFLVVVAFSSCKIINPSQMFRTSRQFNYTDFSNNAPSVDYKIAINDKFSFILSTNQGERLVDPVVSQTGQTSNSSVIVSKQVTYTVDNDGMVKLPIIGRVTMAGKTIKEVEDFLEKEYSKFYNKPFVQLTISNQRIFIFPGSLSGDAKVLELRNANTSLLEAIAESGGIQGGKAHRIKLIRGDMKNPQVYLIDLSSIEGMKRANLIVQANDIIYIESRDRIVSRVMESLAPYLSLATTIILILKIF